MQSIACLPAARQSSDHFIHQSAQIVDSTPTDRILAHNQAGAEGIQNLVQIPGDKAPGGVESPGPHICMVDRRSNKSR